MLMAQKYWYLRPMIPPYRNQSIGFIIVGLVTISWEQRLALLKSWF